MSLIDKLLDLDLRKITDEETYNQKVKKQRNFYFCIACILLLLLVISIMGFIYAHDYQLDQYFTTQYENIYYPIGKERIEAVVNETEAISNPIERLTVIADWEIDGFVNCLQYSKWNESYGGTKPLGCHYIYDDEGRVRAKKGEYTDNPYWIAYHKMGACGELGALFAETAKQAGFEVRNVATIYAKDGNHAWVEVKVNGEWMYFDPTIYWDNHNNKGGNIRYDKWYGTLEEQTIWNEYVTGVYTKDGEDITGNYPNVKQLTGIELIRYQLFNLFSF